MEFGCVSLMCTGSTPWPKQCTVNLCPLSSVLAKKGEPIVTRLPLILGATLAALAFTPLVAEAGHFGGGGHSGGGGAHFGGHFSGSFHGGGVHVGGSFHVGGGFIAGGGRFGRSRVGGYGYGHGGYGWGVRGHVWVGGGYPYWYRPYWYYPSYVPAYYGSYYPVETSEYAGPTAAVVVEPELPRFGIGVFGGMTSTDYNTQNNVSETDLGVLGRFRLTHGLLVEGELGKTSTSVNGQDNVRVDRRLGGSLLYEFGAQNRFAPYVLAGGGVEQASTDGSYNTTQDYAEIGAGLRFALTPHFHLTFDLRAGTRSTVSSDASGDDGALGGRAAGVGQRPGRGLHARPPRRDPVLLRSDA